MAWSSPGSAMFRALLTDALIQNSSAGTATASLGPLWGTGGSDVFPVALYDNSIAPDYSVPTTGSAYGSGVWGTAGGSAGTPQVFQAGQWAQGGVNLSGVSGTATFGSGAGTAAGTAIYLTASNTASGTACTISATYGCLVYDSTLANKRGMCFNYFGGSQSVTSGTFTVVWSTGGVWRITDTFN